MSVNVNNDLFLYMDLILSFQPQNKKPKPEDWKKLDESPTYKGGNRLREYQLEGINWLLFSWFNG